MDVDLLDRLAGHLAANLRHLRQARGLTQARLAERSGVPRSTLANLEAGGGNPTLAVLARLAAALQVGIEELLSAPRAQGRVIPAEALPVDRRGRSLIRTLVPDPLPGTVVERMELPPRAAFRGVPHRPGTREYLACERGRMVVVSGGDRLEVGPGDVAVFQGDRPHSYRNVGDGTAVAFSVVLIAPPG